MYRLAPFRDHRLAIGISRYKALAGAAHCVVHAPAFDLDPGISLVRLCIE
jgi:hypothetical protein